MASPLTILIVEKLGNVKTLSIKDYKEEDLYKKCGFKKDTGFEKLVEWGVKMNNTKYLVCVFGKKDGKANSENKFDFPPPLDTTLLFGNCAIVCYKKNKDNTDLINLSTEMWDKMYEKLFGGFEDLSATAAEDENEKDELDKVPQKYKTKSGYLKDGFIVDDTDQLSEYAKSTDEESLSESDEDDNYEHDDSDELMLENDLELDGIGSELSEDEYLE